VQRLGLTTDRHPPSQTERTDHAQRLGLTTDRHPPTQTERTDHAQRLGLTTRHTHIYGQKGNAMRSDWG